MAVANLKSFVSSSDDGRIVGGVPIPVGGPEREPAGKPALAGHHNS
jgi:hypothetical protein